MSGFDWQTALTWFIAFVISSTFHEAAHGLLAKLGGDLTAYHMGQVTLNPIPHIQREPWGMVLLPVISLLASNGQSCIGYASTAVDPFWAYRNPRWRNAGDDLARRGGRCGRVAGRSGRGSRRRIRRRRWRGRGWWSWKISDSRWTWRTG